MGWGLIRRALVAIALATPVVASDEAFGASSPGASNVLTVVAGENDYSVKGKLQPGWVTIEFENRGTEPFRAMSILPVRPGTTVTQVQAAYGPEGDYSLSERITRGLPVIGGPTVVGPGASVTTMTQLEARRYAVLLFVPTTDSRFGQANLGAARILDVSGPKSAAKPPKRGVIDVMLSDTTIAGLPR